jgi:small GTP-binding protein
MTSIKLILIGSEQVGKTAIINQYVNNSFSEEYIATFAQDKSIKEIILKNETKLKLEIWDTIGQENLRAANKIFMKGAKIALLVYDITNKESFTNLNEFYKQVCDINGKDKIIIGVVGNKNDLYEERVIEEEEGQKYAKDIGASFFETSAKDHETIENLFLDICEQFIKKVNENNNDGKDNSNNKNEGNNEEDKQKKTHDAIKKFGDAPLDGSFTIKKNKKNPKKKGCCG